MIQKPSTRHGILRFETNRSFTGMGHESYRAGEPIVGNRPPDEVARVLLATGEVDTVHVYGQMVTVVLAAGSTGSGLQEELENLYIHYKPGVEVPTEESFISQ